MPDCNDEAGIVRNTVPRYGNLARPLPTGSDCGDRYGVLFVNRGELCPIGDRGSTVAPIADTRSLATAPPPNPAAGDGLTPPPTPRREQSAAVSGVVAIVDRNSPSVGLPAAITVDRVECGRGYALEGAAAGSIAIGDEAAAHNWTAALNWSL